MKRKSFIIFVMVMLLLVGCSSNEVPQTETETKEIEYAIAGKYFLAVTDDGAHTIRFNSDYTVEDVNSGLARSQDKRTKSYGTYEVSGSKLTITMSGLEAAWNCVIHDYVNSITIDGIEFDRVDESKISPETLEAFD